MCIYIFDHTHLYIHRCVIIIAEGKKAINESREEIRGLEKGSFECVEGRRAGRNYVDLF